MRDAIYSLLAIALMLLTVSAGINEVIGLVTR